VIYFINNSTGSILFNDRLDFRGVFESSLLRPVAVLRRQLSSKMRNSTTQHIGGSRQQKATHRGRDALCRRGGRSVNTREKCQYAEPAGPQHQSCEQVQFGGRVRYKPIIEAFSSINYHSAQSPTFMNAHFKMPFKGQGRVYPSRPCALTVFGLSSVGSLGQYIGRFWGISHRGPTLVGVHPIIP